MKASIHKHSILIGHIALTLITFLLIFLPMEKGMVFGAEGDWYSQHVGIGESIRQMMLESGSLLPQYSTLGGGTGIYDFAYYGLLRPDILFSYFMPEIEMQTIISVYGIIGVIASVNLCFFWLRKQNISQKFAFLGAVFFAAAACFFHAHHQIIFVNYMPFLLLALVGIDRLMEKGKSLLLIVSLFLIYMHSFFYGFVCLVVCLIYYLYQSKGRWNLAVFGKGVRAVTISIGLAAIVLIPVMMNILSTEKDAGAFLENPLELVDFTFSGLLYTPYGCGLTIIALYCLLASLTKKKKAVLSVVLLICLTVPAVWLVLNGFLYPRAKIMIPFMPLVVLLMADTLQDCYKGKQKYMIIPAILCLFPALFSQWQLLILIEGTILLIWVLVQRIDKVPTRVKKGAIACLLIMPICISLGVNKGEEYLSSKDTRQSHFSSGDISMFASDQRYRFDVLANNYVNSNLLPDGSISKTSMYSSITNSEYADFYYNTMRNPISLRNRVVLMPNQNSFFNYFMGIRYILTDESHIPYGYKKIFKNDQFVLAENQNVLPICYGTDQLISRKEYEKLAYPENLEALGTRGIVHGNTRKAFTSHIEEESLTPLLGLKGGEPLERVMAYSQSAQGYYVKLPKAEEYILPLAKSLKKKILMIDFKVKSENGRQVEISINDIKNNLSSKYAPYPNHNNTFSYIIPAAETMDKLRIKVSKGEYRICEMRVYTMDEEKLQHQDFSVPTLETGGGKDGTTVFNGRIKMKNEGYFITSYPYRNGYEIRVNGKLTKAEKVNTTFIGFPLKKGEHRIQIQYVAPGYRAGVGISVISLILLVLVFIRERKHAK